MFAALSACALTLMPAAASAVASSPSFTEQKAISRINLVNGDNATVDTRTFSLTVNQTADLDGNQEVDVSWSGAHPTGGIVADPNSGDASKEEYPVVLLECRGQDTTAVPAAQQLNPTTCWTATTAERYQESFATAFPPWRLDRYATATQRSAVVGLPTSLPTGCNDDALAEYWVPFLAANGTTYNGGPNGCGGTAPESSNVGGLNLPSNETYAVTGTNGTGSTKFDVWSDEQNASLGCSETVACALVVVPIVGISCDPAAASLPPADQPGTGSAAAQDASTCEETGAYTPGQLAPSSDSPDQAVTGELWWAASNWRNRITVPLSFAPPSDICNVVGATGGVDLYGAEVMDQAFQQWDPYFCLNPSLFNLKLVQTAEPEARNLLQTGGGVEAVVGSQMPSGGYATPVVDAPIAVTGFAITFDIDNAAGQPVTSLRLDARLLAKLLTESYPAIALVQDSDKALANNPLDISVDPEFIALNPGISGSGGVDATETASTLLALSSSSDVMSALTSYIDNDPAARAWLNGTPDPWGMVVNSAYKGIALPVATWPLLDTDEPPFTSTVNDCLATSPVPYLPLVAAPQPTLADIAQDMQFALAQADTTCNQPTGTTTGEELQALGRQTPGFQFMLGVTSLAEADAAQLPTASLETTVAAGTPTKFTSATGMTFVAPSEASLEAAAKLLTPDTATQTWPIPYQAISTNAADGGSYPGTMVEYAQIPTTGLPATDAADYDTFLQFAATTGQVPGTGNGQLPNGYLPLSAANGLGSLASYTAAAAAAVGGQKGVVPPLVVAATAPSASSPSAAALAPSTSSPLTFTPGNVTTPSSVAASGGPISVASPAPGPFDGILGFVGNTISQISGWAGDVLPFLLALVAFGGLGAVASLLVARRRARHHG